MLSNEPSTLAVACPAQLPQDLVEVRNPSDHTALVTKGNGVRDCSSMRFGPDQRRAIERCRKPVFTHSL
jgi:hypothetical protein